MMCGDKNCYNSATEIVKDEPYCTRHAQELRTKDKVLTVSGNFLDFCISIQDESVFDYICKCLNKNREIDFNEVKPKSLSAAVGRV